jgi:nucleotidyltransferase/DNA polymerase involved in DNA repair
MEKKKNLRDLRNVGKATLKDLAVLEITTVAELANQDPTTLFKQLQKRTNRCHDPCVWDVFAAIIHEAKTGEPTNWWEWTKIRKSINLPK